MEVDAARRVGTPDMLLLFAGEDKKERKAEERAFRCNVP
jgi:hypothetical protein